MTKLTTLLFDVDGTLAETERDGHRVAFNQAFTGAGLDWQWDTTLYGELLAVTGGKERIRYYLETVNTAFQPEGDLDALIKTLHASKTAHYVALLARNEVGLRPGVVRLMAEAREAGMRLAIVTTTTPANVTALISNTLGAAALDWFECIAAGDIVPAKKPAPDIYQYCLTQMQVIAAECLAFEDSGNGVRSSVDAGIPTLVTQNDYTAKDDFTGAVAVYNHLGEPDAPCTQLAGEGINAAYIDMKALHDLHENG